MGPLEIYNPVTGLAKVLRTTARLKVKMSLSESQKANKAGSSKWSDQGIFLILLENSSQSRREESRNGGSLAEALILSRVPSENNGPSCTLKDSSLHLQVGNYPSLHGS